MQKLIELLDKFRRENKTKELFGEPWTLVPLTWKDFIELNKVMIISKEYEFIKWLVDNDKIDLDKTWYKKADFQEVWNWDWRTVRWYEMLLMLLSISNSPIDDLISYLK